MTRQQAIDAENLAASSIYAGLSFAALAAMCVFLSAWVKSALVDPIGLLAFPMAIIAIACAVAAKHIFANTRG